MGGALSEGAWHSQGRWAQFSPDTKGVVYEGGRDLGGASIWMRKMEAGLVGLGRKQTQEMAFVVELERDRKLKGEWHKPGSGRTGNVIQLGVVGSRSMYHCVFPKLEGETFPLVSTIPCPEYDPSSPLPGPSSNPVVSSPLVGLEGPSAKADTAVIGQHSH